MTTKDLSDYVKELGDSAEKAIKEDKKPITKPVVTPAPDSKPAKKTVVKGKDGEVHIVDEPKKAEVSKEIPQDIEIKKEDRIVELLEHFCLRCGHMSYQKAGSQITNKFARPEAWKYLAEICGYYTRVEDTKMIERVNYYRVETTCSLVRKKDDKVVTTVVMAASSDEPWLKGKPVENAYGLATTRAESRAVRSHLGIYMSCVGLEITPYEEFTDAQEINLEEV